MSIFIKKFVALIDSSQRVSGTSSNLSISVPVPSGNNFDRVLVLSCIIPKSYYLIRSSYNTFVIQEKTALGVITLNTIILNVGNYSLTDWMSELKRAINYGSLYTYDITYSSSLGKFLYTVTGNFYQPVFIFTTNVYEQCGFYINSSNTFVSSSLTSTCVINLNPNQMLYICSDMVSNSHQSILEVIPTSCSPDFSFIYYQATNDHTMKELTNNQTTLFNFSIRNSKLEVIDLNGKEISIVLCLHKYSDVSSELVTLLHEFMSQNKTQTSTIHTTSLSDQINTNPEPSLDFSTYEIGFEN